ncbi:hypothetical protein [Streptomyces sp. NPDC052225]|uniref:hypothetical protein n=1 Tax=Streptomyces sp. NPDC052225 TaxID=3154949 RepID=UPI00344AFB06
MYRTTGTRTRGAAGAVALAAVLTLAGCGSGSGPQPRAGGTASSPKAPGSALSWDFAHIADFHGEISDLAVLAEDDVWAVANENSVQGADPYLLHFDGARWRREELPDALGATDHPPEFEEIGDRALWLRPRAAQAGGGPRAWAQWDGSRWSAVPDPPPDTAGDLEATAPDDIWALTAEQTARHWDGARWTSYQLPYPASDLAVVGPDDVWAVGSRSTGPGTELGYGERYAQPASTHWDGSAWASVEAPTARFEKPVPPEPSAGLGQVVALDGGEVRAYGINSFNHGEVEPEPSDEHIRLRWDGTRWADQEPAPGQCALRTPVGQDADGLFLDGNWYLTDDGRCVKITRHRLPLSTGARKGSNQSLWLTEIHRVPGTDEWLGAGHVQVNQSGDPFNAPVVVRLKRRG